MHCILLTLRIAPSTLLIVRIAPCPLLTARAAPKAAGKTPLLHKQPSGHAKGSSIMSLAVGKGGDRLVSADSKGYIKCWDVSLYNLHRDLDKAMRSVDLPEQMDGFVADPSSKLILHAKTTLLNAVHLVNVGAARTDVVEVLQFRAHQQAVTSVQLLELDPSACLPSAGDSTEAEYANASTNFLMTTSADGDVCLFSAKDGDKVGSFNSGGTRQWRLGNRKTWSSHKKAAAAAGEP